MQVIFRWGDFPPRGRIQYLFCKLSSILGLRIARVGLSPGDLNPTTFFCSCGITDFLLSCWVAINVAMIASLLRCLVEINAFLFVVATPCLCSIAELGAVAAFRIIGWVHDVCVPFSFAAMADVAIQLLSGVTAKHSVRGIAQVMECAATLRAAVEICHGSIVPD